MIKKYLLFLYIFVPSLLFAQDSLNMRTVSFWPYGPGFALEYATVNGHNYVLVGSGGGILFINVDDPRKPQKVSELTTFGWVLDIKTVDEKAYVADGANGLVIIDFANPKRPSILSYTRTQNIAQSVDVCGEFAFIADKDSGICVIDVKDQKAPRRIRNIDTPAEAKKIYIKDEKIFLLETPTYFHYVVNFVGVEGGIHVYEGVKTGLLKEVKYYKSNFNDYEFNNLTFQGDVGYFHNSSGGINYLNIRQLPDTLNTVKGNYGMHGIGSGFISINNNQGIDFIFEETYLITFNDSIQSRRGLDIDYIPTAGLYVKPYLYLIGKDFEIYDIQKPNGQQLIGKYILPGFTLATDNYQKNLLVLHEKGLKLFQTEQNLKELSSLECGENNRSMFLYNNYVFVCGMYKNIKIAEINKKKKLKYIGEIKGTDFSEGTLTIGQGICYYSVGSKIISFDINDINNIRAVDTFEMAGNNNITSIKYFDNKLYLGFSVWDSGDVISIINTDGNGKLTYLSGWSKLDTSVIVYEKNNKDKPFKDVMVHADNIQKAKELVKGTKDSIGYNIYHKTINAIAVQDSMLFTVSTNGWAEYYFPDQMRIFSFSSGGSLKLMNEYELPSKGDAISVVGNRAYVADSDSGMRVLDISNIHSINDIGYYKTYLRFNSVNVNNGYMYATNLLGFKVLQLIDNKD
jgi:hypothetical protein